MAKSPLWDSWVELTRIFHLEASWQVVTPLELLVSPSGLFGRNYLIPIGRQDNYNTWHQSHLTHRELAPKKPRIFLIVFFLYLGMAFLSLFPESIVGSIGASGFLFLFVAYPLYAIIACFYSWAKRSASFHKKFPEAITTKQRVPYPFRKKLFVIITNPIATQPMLLFLFMIGVGAIWFSTTILFEESIGMASVILVVGLFFLFFPLIFIGAGYFFRKKYGVHLTVESLKELEFGKVNKSSLRSH